MGNRLKLSLPLSLKELGLRKVAVLFCSNSKVFLKKFQSLLSHSPTCEIKEWLEATEGKMSKLELPESLNKLVIDCIQSIGFELTEWKERNDCQSCGLEVEIELPDVSKLCWTSTGAIDDRKISEQYVLCDRLSNWRRYKIACRNCIENDIPLLWNGLSEEMKKEYEIHWIVPRLECCWPFILEGKLSKLDYLWRESRRNLTSFNQWAFEKSARDGNQVAAEYFFQKLTPEEGEVSVMRTAYGVTNGNILFFLLSVMTPEQQMEIVKARPVHVLYCFLDWPRRHLLPENAVLIWTFLEESDYGNMFVEIVLTLMRRGSCFPKLFQEFLKHAPLDFIKKSFIGHESDSFPPACQVLGDLVLQEESESIEVMFRYADAASRVKLVFCDRVLLVFYYCIESGKWRGVETCLREAALSEEHRGTLQESFEGFFVQKVRGTRGEREFRKFFEFLYETNASDEKKFERLKLD